MRQIPISNIIYLIWIINRDENDNIEVNNAEEAAIPISPKRMCPALMLAASRNERVMNRTEMLRVSVITRNGLSHSGAPLGSRWATKDFGAWVIALIIKLNQRGNPRDRVRSKCLVGLNT